MLVVLASGLWVLARTAAQSRGTSRHRLPVTASAALFDPDPKHIWNRVHACLFVRRGADGAEYGSDTLDPLLWAETKHLLADESHRHALECLDEFISTHAENSVLNPAKRAVFQHDLWAVFDWAASGGSPTSPNRQALLRRLAQVIRRVALTPDQIRGLPDTYSDAVASQQFSTEYDPTIPDRAFLPPDLFRHDAPWVCLSGYSADPTAIMHFSGRSRFLVFLRLSGGREATLEYVRKLRTSGEPPLIDRDEQMLNLRLPQFPVGTQVALARQMILIDARGNLTPTAVTESLQIRVYHAITPGPHYMNFINGPASHDQDFVEFRFSRTALFARRSGGLVAVQPRDMEYGTLLTHGIDPFESSSPMGRPSQILSSCRACHSDSGIHSVQSRLHWMDGDLRSREFALDASIADAIKWETNRTIKRKQRQPEFKLLQRYWRSSGRVN